MARMTHILEHVRRLVERLASVPACSACLAERLDGVAESEVQISFSELAAGRGFARDNDICGLCGEPRAVIRLRA